ncbi:PhrC/PhrF family phosphatase-inhibitory pheromone [Bacillus velezensis]|nr:PhrC/PhrF family phosphatase-inhibitory pheromone [Bacillus velezensis]RAP11775.1 hypothetical protein HS9_03387 [Bacillus velezensis]
MKLKSKWFVICLAVAAIFTVTGAGQTDQAEFHVAERGMT